MTRLSVEHHQACHSAWQALRELHRSTRARVLAGWMVEANAPFPAGLEKLHPSWLAEAIASEPKDLWPALFFGLPGAEAVASFLAHRAYEAGPGEAWPPESVAELQRCVFAPLAPLCVGPAGPLGAALCRLSCESLLAEVTRRGAGAVEAEQMRVAGLAALHPELRIEGAASLWAVAGRLPASLGRPWLKW